MEQRIDLDRLCLTEGATYSLACLLADRASPTSRLRIETNIVLDTATSATVSAAFD
jgi:fibro-slime domain-containing protein